MRPDAAQMPATLFRVLCGLIVFCGLAVVAAVIGAAAGGLFYTLDDPYIHLALAENIARGHYGINGDEYASPSSSVLYPFILAAFLSVGAEEWAPLIVAGAAAVATGYCLGGVLSGFFGRVGDRWSAVAALAVLPFLLLALNVIGLPFTGMEHSLHVLASIAVIIGFWRLDPDRALPWYLAAGIVLAPLLRFEGVALSGAALLALVLLGRWRAGVVLGAVLAACLGLYMFQMARLGLPILPSSVMSKSGVSANAVDGNILSALIVAVTALADAVRERQGAVLVGLIVLTLIGLVLRKGPRGNRLAVAGVAVTAMLAHLFGGDFGWWSRYEIYAIAIGVVACLLLFGDGTGTAGRMRFPRALAAATVFLFIGSDYAATLIKTPAAARNIQLQHYQMHRFATEFLPAPVAVNDLGYVSWKNDVYVLDLWGLGSEKARRRWVADRGVSPEGLRDLTEGAGLAYAMVYEEWIGRHAPDTWCRVGTLVTPQVSVAFPEVRFYLIDPAYAARMEDAVARFTESLPAGATFRPEDCKR